MVIRDIFYRFFLCSLMFILTAPVCQANERIAVASNDKLREKYSDSSSNVLRSESESGDAISSYLLAFAYVNGDKDLEKDNSEAFEYFEKSYKQGFLQSGYYMGSMLFSGAGVEKDIERGLSFLTAAGEAGYVLAQQKLAEFYLFSEEDPSFQNDEKAFFWLRKAADNGDVNSMYNLSVFYMDGRGGVAKDAAEAFHWIMQAVEKDDGAAFAKAGDFYAQGIGTEQDLVRAYMMYDLGGTASSGKKAELAEQMTQEQIDEAVSLSRQWQEDHNSYRPSYHGLEAQGSDGHYEYH